ncbi:MAG: flippase-like domain-containing protein [Candidatus Omnitrophica bacterium]|nr:flippase-like domain-containing protein [Candidatus Omnitrophota bacterium]
MILTGVKAWIDKVRHRSWVLKLGISLILIGFLIRNLNWADLTEVFKSIRWEWCFAGYVAMWGLFALHSLRWKRLLHANGAQVPYRYTLKCYMIGYFFGHFLPTIIGGDFVRAYSMSKYGVGKTRSMTIVLIGRLIGTVAILVLAAICLSLSGTLMKIFNISRGNVVFFSVLLIGAMILGYGLMSSSAWIEKLGKRITVIGKAVETLRAYRNQHGVILEAFLISLVMQLFVFLRYFLVAKAFGFDLSFATVSVMTMLVVTLTMLPITVNGIGIRENGFVYFLGLVGVLPENAFLFSIVNYSLMVLMAVTGAVIYLVGFNQGSRDLAKAAIVEEDKKQCEVVTVG